MSGDNNNSALYYFLPKPFGIVRDISNMVGNKHSAYCDSVQVKNTESQKQ